MDSNEMMQRRQQRAEASKQRQIAHRRMMLRLGLAGAAIVVCAVILFVVAAGQKQPGTTPAPSQPDAVQTTTAPVQTTEDSSWNEFTTVNIAVAGDMNVNSATVASGETVAGYNYSRVFMDVAPLLTNADLTVMNFEGNLCGAPYGKDNASAPQEMMDAMADMGVDLVQMANSYSIRNGLLGLRSTLDGVRAAGMEPLGAYATNEEFRESQGFTLRQINGINVAFVAFTKGMDNLGLPDGSEDCVNVLYDDYATTYQDIATEKINRILRNVRSAKPDYVIALLHWGSEYNDEYSSTQEDIRDLLFEGGVDAIVGTHSHRVQKIEFNREANTFVAYSLGDFFSDTVEAGSNYSVVLNLEITRDNTTGETKLTGYTCTPIYNMTPAESGETALRLVRTEQAVMAYDMGIYNRVSQELYDNMHYSLQRIEYRLAPEEEETE